MAGLRVDSQLKRCRGYLCSPAAVCQTDREINRAIQFCKLSRAEQLEQFIRYSEERAINKVIRRSIARPKEEKTGPHAVTVLNALQQQEVRQPGSVVVRVGRHQRTVILVGRVERIIYLAQHEHDFPQYVASVLTELANVFELDKTIDITSARRQVAKSQSVRISTTCYMALFDKSDEALVNDYEEILQLLDAGSDNPLAAEFHKLIDDFINKEPRSFNGEVEEEWDSASPSDRLVFNSPIPLNSEQRQILTALNKEGCRYITVEGPPGTGKSHTITAVVFEAILRDQSVLVLSDKKEALDVVEDKITETMDRVRYDKNFQNPHLRLGP